MVNNEWNSTIIIKIVSRDSQRHNQKNYLLSEVLKVLENVFDTHHLKFVIFVSSRILDFELSIGFQGILISPK